MAHDRTGSGRYVWIKTVGTADDQLQTEWLAGRGFLLEAVWFPKYPRSIRRGDLLVYYAAGRGVFPAVVEVRTGEVDQAGDHPRYAKRWPWRMTVRPRLVIPNLEDAPTLAEVGLNPLRLRRQSHILLNDDEWEHFRSVFLPVAAASTVRAVA